MGLFRTKRQDSATSAAAQSGPDDADPSPARATADIDLAEARTVITALCSAVGTDAHMRVAVGNLLKASGTPDPNNAGAQMAAFHEDRRFLTRPWRWLCAAARQANDEQQPEIAAMALFWTAVWRSSVEPTIIGANALNIGFDKVPQAAYDELTRHGRAALMLLPKDHVVARTAETPTITCGELRSMLGLSAEAPDSEGTSEAGTRAAST